MGRRRSKETATKDLRNSQRESMIGAVREFNRMVPTLNGFARSLTGNPKIRVKAGQITETDGKVIYIRPPLSLAIKLPHERELCGTRNSDKRLVCERCARDEDVWHKLHHEMAHIMGNSMEAVTSAGVSSLMELVDEYHPEGVCGHASDFLFQFNKSVNYLEATARFSNYLHMILQSMEDARIDARMLQIKPGLRTQFYAAMHEAFTYGVEVDGSDERSFWRDAPIHAQVIIGLSVVAGGYRVQPGWFQPEVLAALSDPRVRSIAKDAGLWVDVKETVSRSVQIFKVLSSMGLFPIDRCTPKEDPSLPGDEPEDESADSDGTDGDPADQGEAPLPQSGGDEDDNDLADPDAGDDADSSDGGDGSGDDAGEPSGGSEGGDAQPGDAEADPTGDGSAGDTAQSGAFGDDFESDARADGNSKEGGSSDDQPDEAPLPADDADEDGGEESGQGVSDGDAGPDGDQAQAGSDESPEGERSPEAGGDADQEDREGDHGSSASDGDPDSDGDLDAEESGGDDDGQPAQQGEGDIGTGSGGSGDGTDPAGHEADGTSPEEATEADDAEEADALGSDSLGEDADEADAPVGKDIWDQANEAGVPFEGMSAEELGTEDQVQDALDKANPHDHVDAGEVDPDIEVDELTDEEIMSVLVQAMSDAIGQASAFDTSSKEVGGVSEYQFPTPVFHWVDNWGNRASDFTPTEQVIGPALLKARIVFADNARSRRMTNLTSGRIDGRKLARRAPFNDERMFYQKQMPGKRDYVVGITVDCSGSTQSYGRMERIKRAVFAKAEILSRLGIKFYITAHTGGREDYWTTRGGYLVAQMNDPHTLEDLMILWVKKVDEPWNDATRKRLANIGPLANNFDGHTLEFHRKFLESRRESDKVLIYYTDGDMPAANYEEELEILHREIPKCKNIGISLLAVGINTESPAEYGFDTVRVDSDEDIIKVVRQLERRLTAGR